MHQVRSTLLGLLIAAPFYWLLIDTTSSPELIAGAVSVGLTAAAYSAAYAEAAPNAAFRLRWLTAGLRELSGVPAGVVIVCREVLAQAIAPRACRGALTADPFPVPERDEPHILGRHALAEGVRSLAPHTIVIGVDRDTDELLLHRIGPAR